MSWAITSIAETLRHAQGRHAGLTRSRLLPSRQHGGDAEKAGQQDAAESLHVVGFVSEFAVLAVYVSANFASGAGVASQSRSALPRSANPAVSEFPGEPAHGGGIRPPLRNARRHASCPPLTAGRQPDAHDHARAGLIQSSTDHMIGGAMRSAGGESYACTRY